MPGTIPSSTGMMTGDLTSAQVASQRSGLIASQMEDTKSAVGEIFESTAQVASTGIDEISQVLHVLDNPWMIVRLPLRIPHPGFDNKYTVIDIELRFSTLRVMGILAVIYWIWKASPGQNNGKWNFIVLDSLRNLMETLAKMPDAMVNQPGDNTIFRPSLPNMDPIRSPRAPGIGDSVSDLLEKALWNTLFSGPFGGLRK